MLIEIARLLFIFFMFTLSIFIHEAGHWLALPRKTKLRWEGLNPIFDVKNDISPRRKIFIYLFGILLGMIPIIYFFFLDYNIMFKFGMLGMYFIGCQWDIEQILKIYKVKKMKKEKIRFRNLSAALKTLVVLGWIIFSIQLFFVFMSILGYILGGM